MKPGWLVVAALAGLAVSLASGCASAPPVPGTQPSVQAPSVVDSVVLQSGVEVRLVSITPTPPASWINSVSAVNLGKAPLWLAIDVVNSSDASLALFHRTWAPSVRDASGRSLRPRSSSGRSDNGGGYWGLASGRGSPYLNPGGIRHELHSFAATAPVHPLTVTYRGLARLVPVILVAP